VAAQSAPKRRDVSGRQMINSINRVLQEAGGYSRKRAAGRQNGGGHVEGGVKDRGVLGYSELGLAVGEGNSELGLAIGEYELGFITDQGGSDFGIAGQETV
jgi:hypothetical protein